MKSIFFDLETTGLDFCGQILNYSFVTVDSNWKVVSSLNDSIHISRLQLPAPGAILANRIDVVEHQKQGYDNERTALWKIRKYIQGVVDTSREEVNLIGFNSARFDVHFLRTSFIRNGINPYFGKSIVYRDVLHVAQKIAVKEPDFVPMIRDMLGGAFSLSLSKLVKIFLDQEQIHESSDDVRLTIELAQYFAEKYNVDVRKFDAYEPDASLGDVYIKKFPIYDASHHKNETDTHHFQIMSLIHDKGNYALWCDLDKFDKLTEEELKDREAVRSTVLWFTKPSNTFFVHPFDGSAGLTGADKVRYAALASDAAMVISNHKITIQNYWPPKNCDVEAFIYDLSFDGINSLYDAIWAKDTHLLKEGKELFAEQLYIRHLINSTSTFSLNNSEVYKKFFLKEIDYRYNGKMKINKMDNTSVYEPGVYNKSFHPTFGELYSEIKNKLKEKTLKGESRKLMKSLLEFYEKSDVYAVGGGELVENIRVKSDE